MSRNIVIQEGGQPKNLTVKKLQTELSGGGQQYWVPEDSLQTLSARQNGTYRPEGEYNGFSEVEVYVEGTTPTPGGHTSYKPRPTSEPVSAMLYVITISNVLDGLVIRPRITIGNYQQEQGVS